MKGKESRKVGNEKKPQEERGAVRGELQSVRVKGEMGGYNELRKQEEASALYGIILYRLHQTTNAT